MSNLIDDSEFLNSGFVFNSRYRIIEELETGGQSRIFVVEDIDSSNEKLNSSFVFF